MFLGDADVCSLFMQVQGPLGDSGAGLQALPVCCKCNWLLRRRLEVFAKRCSEKIRGIFRRPSVVSS